MALTFMLSPDQWIQPNKVCRRFAGDLPALLPFQDIRRPPLTV
jgi:hypothetical protein